MSTNITKIFTGNSCPQLATAICEHLDVEVGRAEVATFADGETSVDVGENVRGMDVFVIQSTCAPANTHLMELLILLDALRRSSARRITAVIPYYGYARQDRKVKPRTPITAKLVADLISTAGAERVLCLDLHAGQIQGFFNIPVDNIYAMPVLLQQIRALVPPREEIVVVSPDAGTALIACEAPSTSSAKSPALSVPGETTSSDRSAVDGTASPSTSGSPPERNTLWNWNTTANVPGTP